MYVLTDCDFFFFKLMLKQILNIFVNDMIGPNKYSLVTTTFEKFVKCFLCEYQVLGALC